MRRVNASTFWRRHGRDISSSSSSRYLFLDFSSVRFCVSRCRGGLLRLSLLVCGACATRLGVRNWKTFSLGEEPFVQACYVDIAMPSLITDADAPVIVELELCHGSFSAFPSYEDKHRLEIRFYVEKRLRFLQGIDQKELGEESDNESDLKFIPYFDSSFVEFVQPCFCFTRSVLVLSSNWFPLMRVKWLPLMANSFAVLGMVIAEPGVGATTRSTAHMGSLSTDEELREFTSEYYIPFALHPVVPAASASIADFPEGKVGVYTRFFEFANQRVPLSLFMCNVLNYYRLHISQLHCIGAAKITNFEVNCRLLAINPTVHLFRAFYHTSWSNGWVSFSKRAGRLQCYTEKLDALRRWREMFFWVDDALVPWDFAFYTQGSLPRDERPPPGSYSMEDAELINENRIPINAYSEAFLCHMGISRNYFQSPEEVPTFIGDDGQEMDLFSVVHLSKPKLVTEGVRPLRDGEEPLLESTAGRTMELVLEQPEVESTDVLAPTPLRSVPGATVEPPRLDATSVGSSEDADVAGAESEAGEVDSGLKRKRATSDDGAGTSKRVRHVILVLELKSISFNSCLNEVYSSDKGRTYLQIQSSGTHLPFNFFFFPLSFGDQSFGKEGFNVNND
ncbi:hypothetical protein Tco_0476094 [Tanacetum coccineum]